MTQKLTLSVTSRAQTGRSASRRLRKVKRIPAIIYGMHTNPEKLSIDVPEFVRLLKAVAGRAKIIELTREDKKDVALAFLQEVFDDSAQLKTLISRHPEAQELAGKMIGLYSEITAKGLANEKG